MKITKIDVSNFRAHKSTKLVLGDDKSDLTIFIGKNGAGKTSLLDAITWCLYAEWSKGSQNSTELLNQSTILDTNVGDYADVQVSVEVKLDDGQIAQITRKQTFKKIAPLEIEPHGSNVLIVDTFKAAATGNVIEPNPVAWIESNMPSRFRPYFLFDGERLEKFFVEADAPMIKRAIQEVAKIDVLERIATGSGLAADELQKKATKLLGNEGISLEAGLTRLNSEISGLQIQIDQLTIDIGNIEAEQAATDAKLGSNKDLVRNVEEKRRLSAQLESTQNKLKELNSTFLQKCIRTGPAAFAKVGIDSIEKRIDSAKENRVLPPPFAPSSLRELIDQQKCICGTALTPHSESCVSVEKIIESFTQTSAIGELLQAQVGPVSGFNAALRSDFEHLRSINADVTNERKNEKSLLIGLKALEEAVIDHDDELISQMGLRSHELRANRDELVRTKQRAETTLGNAKSAKEDLIRDIEKAAKKSADAQQAQRVAKFAANVAFAAKSLHEQLNEQVRLKVAENLDENYKSMIWKKDFIEQVQIDESFKVSVRNNLGFEILSGLSAGESTCLAFAFSLTLSTVAGLNFPIVADSPMGRLSPEVQVELSTVLAAATAAIEPGDENHQLILLMTETEYNEKVAKAFSARRPRVFEILFNTENSEATVREHQ